MLLVNDVNWLYFGQKHKALERFIAMAKPRSQRISIIFAGLRFFVVCFYDYRYNFDMIKEVDFPVLAFIILDDSAIVDVSFQIFDVIFNILGFVGNWKIKRVVSQTEA